MRSSFRELADSLAEAGLSTLRFDYPGTGDSLDAADGSWRFDDWVAATKSAAALLRDIAEAERLVIIGQGLGAAIALRAADELEDVVGLALLGGFTRGALYLKQLKVSAAMLAEAAGFTPSAGAENGLVLLGFALPASFVADVKLIDFRTGSLAPAPSALVVGRPGDRQSAELAERLERFGAAVERLDYNDYESLASNPPITTTPLATLDAVSSWAQRIAGAHEAGANSRGAPVPADVCMEAQSFFETRFRFGRHRLYGVFCEPKGPVRGRVLLFLNCGANPHTGWRRMTVEQARFLAERGIASLRIDTSGIGDSPARPDAATKIYSPHQVEEASAAIDWLRDDGAYEITLVGVCSGAYQALHTAIADRRVDDLVIVNQAAFAWDDKYTVEEFVRYFSRSNLAYLSRLTDTDGLRKLLLGRVDVVRLIGVLAARALDKMRARLSPFIPWLRGPIGRRVHRLFAELRARGVRISLVTCENDLSEDELTKHFGRGAAGLRAYPNVSWSRIADADLSLIHI